VISKGSWNRGYQCSRRGAIEEDGKMWCRQHLPSVVKERRAEQAQASEQRWAEEKRRKREEEWHRVLKEIAESDPELADQVHRFAQRHGIFA
jgi:siroheme synthase (precorrin-2 oxidase/ferrochelatase)